MILVSLSLVSIVMSVLSHSKIVALRSHRCPRDKQSILYLERIVFLVLGVLFCVMSL